jgi:hypothetical protein
MRSFFYGNRSVQITAVMAGGDNAVQSFAYFYDASVV